MAKTKKAKFPELAEAMKVVKFADSLFEIENYPFITDPGGLREFKNERKNDQEEFELKPLIKQIRFWSPDLITAFIRVRAIFQDGMDTPTLVAIFQSLHEGSHEGRERHRLLRYIDDTF